VNLRLRVATPGGDSIPGPILPIAGRSARTFQPGFALAGGWWFNEGNTRGVDASFFTLGGGDTTLDGVAPGMLVLFPEGAGSAPQVIVLPSGFPVTSIFPVTLSTWFVGADVNYRHNLHCGPCSRLDLLAGYRFAFLEDEIFLGESPDGSNTDYRFNRLAISNPFHGGQIGLAGEYRGERWYVSGTAKVAFGAVRPELCASGFFRAAEGFTGNELFVPAGPRAGLDHGGYRALAAIRSGGESRFAVLPSLNAQLGRQIGEHARFFAGYSLQYISAVARLGDILQPTSSGVQFTDFWVQSLSLGFELRY
jgi:hypothetical protein